MSKVTKNLKNFINCLCIKCPSSNTCMKIRLQKVFCATGKSSCQVEPKGCLCAKCKVAKQYQLNETYYCR
ncbi:MAG: DUF2769 domain-containing protein [Actinomycetota bacterium]